MSEKKYQPVANNGWYFRIGEASTGDRKLDRLRGRTFPIASIVTEWAQVDVTESRRVWRRLPFVGVRFSAIIESLECEPIANWPDAITHWQGSEAWALHARIKGLEEPMHPFPLKVGTILPAIALGDNLAPVQADE